MIVCTPKRTGIKMSVDSFKNEKNKIKIILKSLPIPIIVIVNT